MLDTLTHKLDSIGSHLSSQINDVYLAVPTTTKIYPEPYNFVDSNVMPVAYHLGLDKWDYTAIIIGVFSLGVAIWAMLSQRKTERNTMKITVEGQFGLLMDYIRHFYANLVVSKAMLAKLGGRYSTHYISQEHFRKLQEDIEALHPEAFVHSTDKYQEIHNLLLLIRNFNLETEVAELHICNADVPNKVKERDLNTLIFKQNLFCKSFMAAIKSLCMPDFNLLERWSLNYKWFRRITHVLTLGIWDQRQEAFLKKKEPKQEKEYAKYIKKTRNHLIKGAVNRDNLSDEEKKLGDSEKLNLVVSRWKAKNENALAPIDYFTAKERENNNFAKILFANDSDLFFQLINSNINWEIIGENSQGFEKIAIIPFKPEKKKNEPNKGA